MDKRFVVEPGTKVRLGKIDQAFKDKHESHDTAKSEILLHGSDGNAGELRGATSRKPLRTIASTLEIADVMALTMVLVASLSAYATWKTAQVTKEILLTSQRPYIGTESVNLIGETNPKVLVELRNFGSVQAEDAVMRIVLRVNGKGLSSDSEPQQEETPVVFSPGVPHRFYRHLAADTYRDALKGKANVVVEIQVRYKGPRGDEHCYITRDSYDHVDDIFYPQGGSLSCDRTSDTVPFRRFVG